jgi:hypothetical protein
MRLRAMIAHIPCDPVHRLHQDLIPSLNEIKSPLDGERTLISKGVNNVGWMLVDEKTTQKGNERC